MIEPSEIKKKKSLSFFHSAYFFLALSILVSGCAGEKQSPIYETFKLGISNPNTVIDETPLNPNYKYLKVDANGSPALLVLGYVDPKNKAQQDVWYSAFKEVVEIRGGRLANTEGLNVNWKEVDLSNAPSLGDVLAIPENTRSRRAPKFRYIRTRTVMPGYHVNIRETVIMQALDEAPSDAPKAFKDPGKNIDIRWVEETVLVSAANQNPSVQPLRAIYAINTKTNEVIFGKQYLTKNFYVSWLSWPYPARTVAQDSPKK
jgi:hypothetical protein